MVGLSGLEPPTSRLSGVRSNLLSYRPALRVTSSCPSLFFLDLFSFFLFSILSRTLENEQRAALVDLLFLSLLALQPFASSGSP